MTIAVLVADWEASTQRLSVFDQDERTRWEDPLGALFSALKSRAVGKAVIIRPSFNEVDEHGSFFREWRSFDGEMFYEIRWYMKDLSGISLRHEPPVKTLFSDDRDIVLPNIPPAPICACEEDEN
jgi:hypothetical protein